MPRSQGKAISLLPRRSRCLGEFVVTIFLGVAGKALAPGGPFLPGAAPEPGWEAKMMQGSWFPLIKDLAENEHFKMMPPAHRLYYLLIISEYNLRGKFYKSDLEAAVTIGTSVDTIRRARRELQRLGWIITEPGFLAKGIRPVATTYCEVDFYQVCEGEFFAPIHRYAFEALLFKLRRGELGHKEVLMYVYICYFEARYRDNGGFFISKRELIELTGMPEAPAAVLRLNEIEIFEDDVTLFVIEDIYHKIKIVEHTYFADPEEDENNRENVVKYREDIKRRVEIAKKKQAFKKGEPQEEELLPLFKNLYKEMYGKPILVDYGQEKRLIALAQEHGIASIEKGIHAYFRADIVPNNTGAKTRTLANFLMCYLEFIAC